MVEFTLTHKERELLFEHVTALDEPLRLALNMTSARGGALRLRLPPQILEQLVDALGNASQTASSRKVRRALQRLHGRLGSRLSQDDDDYPAPPPSALPTEMRDELKRVLDDEPFASMEEINRKLDEISDAHNRRPRAEFCGLSPKQVRRLLDADWKSKDSAVVLNDAIPFSDLREVEIFANARILLQALIEEGGTKATTAGNLNRRFIGEVARRARGLDVFIEGLRRWSKTRNEEDFAPLYTLRHTMQFAGLLRKTKGKFRATKKAEKLLGKKEAGSLYALLFLNFFQEFNLAYLDGMPECHALQQTISYSFFMIGEHTQDWITPKDLAPRAILPTVSAEIPFCSYTQEPYDADILLYRIIRPLIRFGLLEYQDDETKDVIFHKAIKSVRKTPLFDGLLSFRLERR